MKKRLLAAVLCVVMVATMTSCGKKEETKKENVKKKTQATEAVKEDTESGHKVEQTEATEAAEMDTEDDEVVPGNSKSNAYLLPLNTKVFGTVKADEYAWFSFKTGDDPNATYNATFVNESTESDLMKGTLMDEYGTEVDTRKIHYANKEGAPETITGEKLEPNTTYYMQIQPTGGYDYDYSVIIKNTSDTSNAYKTIGNVSDAIRKTAQDGDTVESGTNTNINDAVEVPLGAGVHGTIKKDEAAWLSFTTGDQDGVTYNATFVNDSPKSDLMKGTLMDEYGTEVDTRQIHYADKDGAPETITSNELEPNTTYYLQLISTGHFDFDYSVTFKSPDAVAKQSDLIFETPFEINDTQIQFVAESAKFIDEAQAKEVLKPVAEAILKHPESSVLLAGTTATDGDQADRVKLSNRRAEAVKKLLVSTYKVPESQLKTVGLGFEADPFERGQDRDSSGKFVESEGRKNRRVVVMDAKDPIAQQILGQ